VALRILEPGGQAGQVLAIEELDRLLGRNRLLGEGGRSREEQAKKRDMACVHDGFPLGARYHNDAPVEGESKSVTESGRLTTAVGNFNDRVAAAGFLKRELAFFVNPCQLLRRTHHSSDGAIAPQVDFLALAIVHLAVRSEFRAHGS